MANQAMFIGFEGVLVLVAVLVLNFFHPVVCAGELLFGRENDYDNDNEASKCEKSLAEESRLRLPATRG